MAFDDVVLAAVAVDTLHQVSQSEFACQSPSRRCHTVEIGIVAPAFTEVTAMIDERLSRF